MPPMRCATACERCGSEAGYAHSVMDAGVPGTHPSEAGYRLAALCWRHSVERRQASADRYWPILVVDGVGHADMGHAGGDCVCETCGKVYYEHKAVRGYSFLTMLCDGSIVKL